jgi:hypothetical protein
MDAWSVTITVGLSTVGKKASTQAGKIRRNMELRETAVG